MSAMAVRAVRLLALVSLLVSMGLPAAALQAFAFAKMTIEAVRRGDGLAASVGETFDGLHPCAICVSLRATAPAETMSAVPTPSPALLIASASFLAPGLAASRLDAVRPPAFASRDAAPPVPPPPSSLS